MINIAGPESSVINKMANVSDNMKIGTRPLKQEVAHIPCPPDFDFENNGFVISDSDIGCYTRPEIGNHILIESEGPECDTPQWMEGEEFDANFTEQWTVQVMRAAQRIPDLPVTAPVRGVTCLYDVSDD